MRKKGPRVIAMTSKVSSRHPGLDLKVGVSLEPLVQGGPDVARATGRLGQDRYGSGLVKWARKKLSVTTKLPSGALGLKIPAHHHGRGPGLGEAHRDHRAHREVLGVRRGRIDKQLAGGQGRSTSPGSDGQQLSSSFSSMAWPRRDIGLGWPAV
jgi:hypothetical protein